MAFQNRSEITEKVLSTVASFAKLERSRVDVNSKLTGDLNIDSLGLVSLIVRLEEELNLEIDDEAMVLKGLYTVQDIINATRSEQQ